MSNNIFWIIVFVAATAFIIVDIRLLWLLWVKQRLTLINYYLAYTPFEAFMGHVKRFVSDNWVAIARLCTMAAMVVILLLWGV